MVNPRPLHELSKVEAAALGLSQRVKEAAGARPGQVVAQFPASLSNYQGYPKTGGAGFTFQVEYEHLESAFPLMKLQGLQFIVTLRRPYPESMTILDMARQDEEGEAEDEWEEVAGRLRISRQKGANDGD